MLLLLLACATMQRTWEFTASGVYADPALALTVVRARVAQEDLRLTLRLDNPSEAPVEVVLGALSLDERPLRPAAGEGLGSWLVARLGASPRVLYSGTLAPGASAELELRAHVPFGDLRRREALTLSAGELLVNALPVPVQLTLSAPPEAPRGERR